MKALTTFGCLLLLLEAPGQTQQPPPHPFAKQIPNLMRIPHAIDSNGDGELSMEEVQAAPNELAALDNNGDGQLDYKEMGAYEDDLPLIRDHNITNFIDADGNVHISPEEMNNAASALKTLDANGDWHISKKEIGINKMPGAPLFSTRRLPMPIWKMFRGYADKLEGPLPPGKSNQASEGYILVHDAGDNGLLQQSDETYLIGPNGEKVHEWKHQGYSPEGSVAYLLPNGHLLRSLSKHHWTADKPFPVGAHSTIQILDWDSNVLWEFTMSVPEKYSLHHDIEYLPNGNVLALRYTAFTVEEAAAMGWDPALGVKAAKSITKNDEHGLVWLASLLELKPNLTDGSTEIVWQWDSWDHLVQNQYPDKSNYGDINDPHKIHINYLNLDKDVPFNAGQIFHLNAVDYNPKLDMIMLSSTTYGEVWFIDHSTSLEEASASEGGNYKRGGDLLYRWGNNEAFGKGTRDDSILFWQHDAQWIPDGLPGAGNILIYNNGTRRTLDNKFNRSGSPFAFGKAYTNLVEVNIPMTSDGNFSYDQEPEIAWHWESSDKADFYSPFMSGLQRLPNGNTLFCRAFDKHIFEVTPEGKKVLDFSPAGWGRLYRVYKYAPDYSGLKF